MTRLFFNKIGKLLIPLTLFLVGLYLVPLSILETNFSKIPGDLGDARFSNYILEYGHHYLTGVNKEYWNAPFMFPQKNTIVFSENFLGSLPIYSFIRLIGYDRETSFQLWILALFILNFICCFWVLNRWSNNYILSAVGAYIFAFSILLVGNIYNVQTLPRFILPFLFYWLWRFLTGFKIKYLAGFVIGLVYQFYCGIYLGFLSFYVLLFFTISFLIINKDWSAIKTTVINTQYLLKLLLCFVGASLLILPLMFPYYEQSKIHGVRTFDEVINTIPQIQSYFFTDTSPILWRSLSEHGKTMKDWWCHFLFLGALPWLSIALTPIVLFSKKVSKNNKNFLKIVLVGLFLCLLFGTNFNGWTMYKLIYHIPGFSSMRSVNRLVNTEVFFFILIIVFFFNELRNITKHSKWIIAFLPIFVIADNLIYADNIMRFDKKIAQERIEKVTNSIQTQYNNNDLVVAYMPFNIVDDNLIYIHLDAMLASQALKLKCVNAYTGSYPEKFWPFFANLDYPNLTNWLNKNGIQFSSVGVVNETSKKETIRKKIYIKSKKTNFFLCREWDNKLYANKIDASIWETFEFVGFNNNQCAIRSFENKFLTTDFKDKEQLIANRNSLGDWEVYSIIKIDNDFVAFKAFNNKYWSVDPQTLQVFATASEIGENEKFELKEI